MKDCDMSHLVEKLIPWLKAKKLGYEEKGLIPTLELLIEDLEKKV